MLLDPRRPRLGWVSGDLVGIGPASKFATEKRAKLPSGSSRWRISSTGKRQLPAPQVFLSFVNDNAARHTARKAVPLTVMELACSGRRSFFRPGRPGAGHGIAGRTGGCTSVGDGAVAKTGCADGGLGIARWTR